MQFPWGLPAWPKWTGCPDVKKTKHRLGETYAQYGPFSWSAQNLSQALVLAGVSVKKGQEEVNISCPIVISDAGLFNTYQYLLPENARCLPGKNPAGAGLGGPTDRICLWCFLRPSLPGPLIPEDCPVRGPRVQPGPTSLQAAMLPVQLVLLHCMFTVYCFHCSYVAQP